MVEFVGIREGFHEQEVGIFLRAGDKLGEWGVFREQEDGSYCEVPCNIISLYVVHCISYLTISLPFVCRFKLYMHWMY